MSQMYIYIVSTMRTGHHLTVDDRQGKYDSNPRVNATFRCSGIYQCMVLVG